MPEGPFRGVIGGFNAFLVDERPKPLPMVVKLFAHADEAFVAGEDTAQQQAVHRRANGGHTLLKSLPRDLSRTMIPPMLEYQFDLPHQVMS